MKPIFKKLDIFPLVKQYMDELDIVNSFRNHLPSSSTSSVSSEQVLCILIGNILASPKPLYKISEWLADYTDGIGEQASESKKYNDDRIGRALDALYKTDRHSLQTEIAASAIKIHDLKTDTINNDSTSISFSGAYRNQPEGCAKLKRGFNKDGRSDDKQLVYGLNTTGDGHVPLGFRLYDGNQNDATTHQPNWGALRDFLDKSDFIYIADCKLCSQSNLDHISKHGGLFITPIPSSYLEAKSFISNLKSGKVEIQWEGRYEAKNPRNDSNPNVFQVYEGDKSRSGHRIIWVHSSYRAIQDKEYRERQIEKAKKGLEKIKKGINKRNLKTKESLEKEIKKVTKRVKNLVKIQLFEEVIVKKVHSKRGRPSKDTQGIESQQIIYDLEWEWNEGKIKEESKADGVYPLVSNTKLTPIEVLTTYKTQAYLEKRFYTKKSVMEVAPVFLKKPERIEAIFFLYFIALMVISLIERHLRKELKDRALAPLPILPGKLKTITPTWNNIRYFFRNVHICVIEVSGKVLDTTTRGIDKLHEEVLDLFGLHKNRYQNISDGWWNFSMVSSEYG